MGGDTRVVEVVWAYDPATDGPDLDRIGQRLTLPKVDARRLVNEGSVRYADVPVDDADRDLANLPRSVAAARARELGLAVDANESKTAIIGRIAEAEKAAETTSGETVAPAAVLGAPAEAQPPAPSRRPKPPADQ